MICERVLRWFHLWEPVRARLAAIVECSDDAIIGKDLEGIIETWNAGAERLFGYTQQEAIGQPVTLLIPPERVNEEPASPRAHPSRGAYHKYVPIDITDDSKSKIAGQVLWWVSKDPEA